jgi:hypothetical protein
VRGRLTHSAVIVVFIVIGLLRSGLDPAELAKQGTLF